MINKSIAMGYLSNNEGLYLNFSKKFYNNYKDINATINSYKPNQEDEKIYPIIHDIKGTALYVGATTLHQLSTELCDIYKKGNGIDYTLLESFQDEISLVIEEIGRLF